MIITIDLYFHVLDFQLQSQVMLVCIMMVGLGLLPVLSTIFMLYASFVYQTIIYMT